MARRISSSGASSSPSSELALDDDGTGPYHWVKHIYIDDPISSLDEHNAIAVANHLAKLLKRPESRLKTVISTHHTLFFNVLCNELKKANKYFLRQRRGPPEGLLLSETGDTPFFDHVAVLAKLYEADRNDKLYTYHFNMLLRNLGEDRKLSWLQELLRVHQTRR